VVETLLYGGREGRDPSREVRERDETLLYGGRWAVGEAREGDCGSDGGCGSYM
jgi:hypothetical protein